MKKTVVLLSVLIVSFVLSAQIHIPASKSIVGVWRQTGSVNLNGNIVKVTTGNYKIINPDGTEYTIITWKNGSTTIGFYATYTLTSDSTCIEHFIKHANPINDGKAMSVKFKLIDENTLKSYWQYDERSWVGEIWTRLQVGNQN